VSDPVFPELRKAIIPDGHVVVVGESTIVSIVDTPYNICLTGRQIFEMWQLMMDPKFRYDEEGLL
jgi:hypothetical protein